VAIKDVKRKWAQTQQRSDENGYPGMERDGMMEDPGAPRQRTCGASSFGADEWVQVGPTCQRPEAWPEWKQEDNLAYQQYVDEFFRGDKD
jgi:hypothetical protein